MKFSNFLKMLGLSLVVTLSTQTTAIFAEEEASTESFAIESAVPVESSTSATTEPEINATETHDAQTAESSTPHAVEPEKYETESINVEAEKPAETEPTLEKTVEEIPTEVTEKKEEAPVIQHEEPMIESELDQISEEELDRELNDLMQ